MARIFAIRRPFFAWRVLRKERSLDGILRKSRVCRVSAQTRRRIVDDALRRRGRSLFERWVRGAGLGAGLAVACAAGLATGFALVPQFVTAPYLSIGADPTEDAAAALRDPTDLGEA